MQLKLLLLVSLVCPSNAVLAQQHDGLVPAVITILLGQDSDSNPSGPNFGSVRVAESARPSRDWLTTFVGIMPEPLSGNLQDTIDTCENGSACVVEIDQLDLTETIYLNRSNIKLVGKTGNKITYTGTGSLFLVETGAENIVLEGLNIDGRIAGNPLERDPDIYGIYLFGDSIRNVLIKDNSIVYLDGKEGAHGIAVLGTGATERSAISDISIEGNQLDNLRTGFSESIVVNGNVSNWEIIDNQISNVNNIAIDAIGGEGTSPTRQVDGRTLPGLFDAARMGFIQNNRVNNMSTLTNPAYGSQHSYAAGIYIDGGRDILVSGNEVNNTPWAYEIGAENCVETSNITLDGNYASNSRFGDLLIGGYATGGFLTNSGINCNPATSEDADEGHGYVLNTTVKNNQLDSEATMADVIELSNRILNTIIIQAGIDPVNTDGIVSGDQNSIRTSE